MVAKSVNVKLPLGLAPSVDSEGPYFNELLTLYSAVHALHAALGQYTNGGDDPNSGSGDLLQGYTATSLSRLTAEAASNITAGKFLELFVSGGKLKVRHTVQIVGDQSYGCCGISTVDVAAGGMVTVFTEPTVVSGFSGLAPGTLYYAYDDGAFTTQPNATIGVVLHYFPECGVAISTTHMRLKGRI